MIFSLHIENKTIIYDVSGMRRYSQNILQWRKIVTKSTNHTHWRLLWSATHKLEGSGQFSPLNLAVHSTVHIENKIIIYDVSGMKEVKSEYTPVEKN